MVFNGEGCATIVLLYTNTESREQMIKGMDKGKKSRLDSKLRCWVVNS